PSAPSPALPRAGQRCEHGPELLAQVLECGREDERLAQVRRVLVGREARAERRDLEQDAARLAEVDRAEPEAVDDRRRPPACLLDARAPRLLLVHRARPRDVVHRARARNARSRRGLVPDPAAARLAARLSVLEPESVEERLVAVEIGCICATAL